MDNQAVLIKATREVTQVDVSRNLLLYGFEHLDFDSNWAIVNAVSSLILPNLLKDCNAIVNPLMYATYYYVY